MADATPPARRILVITRNLPPLVGGMERLLHNAVRELAAEFEVSVIGPKGCENELSGLQTVVGISPYPLWRFLFSCLHQGNRLGRTLRPDVVFAGSGLTAPVALIVSRLTGAAAVAQLHGLDLVAQNRLYRAFFVSTLRRLDAVIVNSRNTAALAAEKRIPADRTFIVHPGITMPDPDAGASLDEFLRARNLLGKRILLSVGRITERKGLSRFIQQCLPDIVRRHPDAVLVIVGAPPSDALKTDNSEIVKINDVVAAAALHDHVRLPGSVSDEECDLWYRCSDIFVFPGVAVAGDVEGFGIVAIEAAARGVPTVAFAVGGVTDAVRDGYSGYLVPAEAYGEFSDKVARLLDNPDAISPSNCLRHADRFKVSNFGHQMRTTFTQLTESASTGA